MTKLFPQFSMKLPISYGCYVIISSIFLTMKYRSIFWYQICVVSFSNDQGKKRLKSVFVFVTFLLNKRTTTDWSRVRSINAKNLLELELEGLDNKTNVSGMLSSFRLYTSVALPDLPGARPYSRVGCIPQFHARCRWQTMRYQAGKST